MLQILYMILHCEAKKFDKDFINLFNYGESG